MAPQHWLTLLTIAVASVQVLAQDAEPAVSSIPESAIEDLARELDGLVTLESTTAIRRASKKIFRGAEALLEEHSDAPERFRVLGIVFDMQKHMYAMRQTDDTRDALLESAALLMEAPDAYATLRVEPDMMLVQIALSEGDPSPDAMALEIAGFADRYRDTPAEAQSLMMAASSAFDIGNRDLLSVFRMTLEKRFSDDAHVAGFMRERFGSGSEVHFRGTFPRADGARISFPVGQIYVVCFWSSEASLLSERVAEVKALQERYAGQFKVFSFNLDERSDHGAGLLRRMQLDWVPMQLPGGVDNPVYRSIGGANPFAALVIDGHGLARKGATGRDTAALHKRYEAAVAALPYPGLLRSLCIGDYLLDDSALPQDLSQVIASCLPLAPQRYALSLADTRTGYEKIEQICGDALETHGGAPNLYSVHNHRIVALLGLWRLSGERSFLDRALASAKAVQAMDMPAGDGLIAKVCMATDALMADDANVAEVLGGFITAAGGTDVSGARYAAALMLSLEAHSRKHYIRYRDALLGQYANDVSAWPVASFLLDSSSAARLFEHALPGGVGEGVERPVTQRHFVAEWDTPGATSSVINAFVFTDITDDRNAALLQKSVVDHLVNHVARRPGNTVRVTGIFPGSDTRRVASYLARNKWSINTVCLEDAEWQFVSAQLGVLAAGVRPNVYLVRQDGQLLLALSGLSPDTERADLLIKRIDTALRDYDLGRVDAALADERFADAATHLATSFPLKNRRRERHEPEWLAETVHRRKLVWAFMQAGQWEQALVAANENIVALRPVHNSREAVDVTWCRSCHGHLLDMSVRIALLRELGQTAKADEEQSRLVVPECSKGRGAASLQTEVVAYMKNRRERFRHWQDPVRYLAEHERNMRSLRQDLYGFGIETDLMMRAEIHEQLGTPALAVADRNEAQGRAWPFAPRTYAPALEHCASVDRRAQARARLAEADGAQALELLNTNIQIHEDEANRCNSMCKICSAQVQNFGFYARTLDELGRTQDAEASRAMAEDAKCPPGEERESFKSFPINRMYGGGSGINRLNFIENVMRGGNYANAKHRELRMGFASDLSMRARALDALGKTDAATADRKRANALAYPLGPDAASDSDGLPGRYIDVLSVGDDK